MKNLLCMTFVAGCLIACGPKPQENKAADNGPAMKARFQAINDAFNTGNTSAIDTLLAANVVDHSEDTSLHLPKGPAGLKQMISMMREGQTAFKSEVKMMVAEGDVLMVYGTMSATNTGPSMGMPGTNNSWSADWADIIKFGPDLKMIEHWGVFDQYKMLQDLGVISSGPAEGKK